MAGIYIHIPFCKQACHYCNFHFSTTLRQKDEMLNALLREIEMQRDYLGNEALTSVYFGGGTPSLLEVKELMRIFEAIAAHHVLLPNAEITLEANPDDLTAERLLAYKKHTPINRLSIGIQSFARADLAYMNRAHNALEAGLCVENAIAAGFENLTIDLIYGTPTMSNVVWRENLQRAFDYGIGHLSCYALTVEPKTALAHFVKTGKSPEVSDEQAAAQFEILLETAALNGYEQYEISNFAKEGRYAVHNTNYWRGKKYLGIGPSAHSFDGGRVRQWNVANNPSYIKAILLEGQLAFEREVLSDASCYNEYIMTALRTKWGVYRSKITEWKGVKEVITVFEQMVDKHIKLGNLVECGDGCFKLTATGKLLANDVMSDFFVV